MTANPEPADHVPDFWLQRDHGGLIQVVPVVVGDQQVVDFRHIFCRIDACTRKGFVGEGHRRGVEAEYRVNEDSPAADLPKIR